MLATKYKILYFSTYTQNEPDWNNMHARAQHGQSWEGIRDRIKGELLLILDQIRDSFHK